MENLVVFAKKKFTLDKFLTQAKITTENEVKKVLNLTAKSSIVASDFAGGTVSVSGKIFVSALYLSVDGSVEQANTVVEFVQKQQTNFTLLDSFACDNVQIEYFTGSGTDILCSICHNLEVVGNFKYEVPAFEENENHLVLSKKTENVLSFVASAEDNFVFAEENESNIKNMNILNVNATSSLLSAVCLVDKVVVEGKVIAEIVYKDSDSISTIQKEFEYKQEIAANGTLPNMKAYAFVTVKNATITPEEKEDKTNLVCAFDVFAKCYVYDESVIEVVDDLFSLSHEVNLVEGFIETKNFKRMSQGFDTILSSTNVADIENFDDVQTVFDPKFVVKQVTEEDGKAVVDGEIIAKALYTAGSENCVLEIKTDTKFEIEKEAVESVGSIYVIVQVSGFKVKAGKELETTFKFEHQSEIETTASFNYVEKYDEVKEKNAEQGGIKVYITKQGETLFDVAKVLSVKPEIIASQNEVLDIFESGEKIYVYSQVNLL